nr:MAG TPA: hypothetical protein [Caudoviricetes sp.]
MCSLISFHISLPVGFIPTGLFFALYIALN